MQTRLLLLSSKLKPSTLTACLKEFSCELDTDEPAQLEQLCQYDIVILDVTGKEDAKRISDMRSVCPWLLVMALHAFGDELAERRAIESGVDDILCLPVSNTRLKLTLQNLIRLRVMERIMGATKRLALA